MEAGEADSSMLQESEPQETSKKRRLDQDTPIATTQVDAPVEQKASLRKCLIPLSYYFSLNL